MILQRDAEARKQQQQQYRKELYASIQQKQTLKNKSRVLEPNPPKQTFSLIKNIEDEEQRRKNKKKQYYAELERQRVEEMEFKRRRLEDEKRKQLEMDAKIEKQNQMLRLRYEEEKKRENKKQNIANQRAKEIQKQFLKKQQERTQRKDRNRVQPKPEPKQAVPSYPQDSIDDLQYQQEQEGRNRMLSELPVTFAYPGRLENQEFNFPQRRVLSTNYYRELQIQKRKFEEETNEMRELNRYLGAQRTNFSKRNNQGLQSLRQLERMLDDQTANLKQQLSSNYRSKTQISGVSGVYNSSYYGL